MSLKCQGRTTIIIDTVASISITILSFLFIALMKRPLSSCFKDGVTVEAVVGVLAMDLILRWASMNIGLVSAIGGLDRECDGRACLRRQYNPSSRSFFLEVAAQESVDDSFDYAWWMGRGY